MSSFNWSKTFSADMSMSVGSVTPDMALETCAPVFEGFQVIVLMNGWLRSRINDARPFDIADPAVFVVLARGRQLGYDRMEAGTLQRYVRIGIDAESAQRNGIDFKKIAASDGPRLHGGDVDVIRLPLTPKVKAIAMQAFTCPVQGDMRDLYLAGKGMELAAVTISELAQETNPGLVHLGRRDLERLWYARELALAHYQDPLSLHELASRVGTNVNKLNQGFRQAFGASVFEFIQRHRLQEAHRMLSTGAFSVSEVALSVGYAIPHFSTLFRKHFGCSPSQLTV